MYKGICCNHVRRADHHYRRPRRGREPDPLSQDRAHQAETEEDIPRPDPAGGYAFDQVGKPERHQQPSAGQQAHQGNDQGVIALRPPCDHPRSREYEIDQRHDHENAEDRSGNAGALLFNCTSLRPFQPDRGKRQQQAQHPPSPRADWGEGIVHAEVDRPQEDRKRYRQCHARRGGETQRILGGPFHPGRKERRHDQQPQSDCHPGTEQPRRCAQRRRDQAGQDEAAEQRPMNPGRPLLAEKEQQNRGEKEEHAQCFLIQAGIH